MGSYGTQGSPNARASWRDNQKNVYSIDPSVKPGTPAADFTRGFGTKGTVVTTAGPANSSVWANNTNRHASGGVVIASATKAKDLAYGTGFGQTMRVIDSLSYEETLDPTLLQKYTFVNQSIKIKGLDGKDLYYKGYYIVKPPYVEKKVNKSTDTVKEVEPSLNKYQWNLPPHKWSMPVLPSSDPNFMPSGYSRPPVQDRYRRGRIWWAANDPNLSVIQAKGSNTTQNVKNILDQNNHRFGFQFLWNPQEYRSEIAVQMDAVPMAADRFIGGPGAFPATESIGFTIRLDRTNDFAHAASNFARPTLIMPETQYVDVSGKTADSAERTILAAQAAAAASINQGANFVTKDMVKRFVPYYRAQGSFAADDSDAVIQEKLIDLFQRGTMADLEFLFKTINGLGSGGSKDGKLMAWTNSRGVMTADIGYLIPTLLYIDIGPASYKGYMNSISIQHGAFTQEMIPIRTDVSVTFQIVASAGLTSKYVDSQVGTE